MTYILHTGEPASITCGDCGRRSYHPLDVKNRYCGFCNRYHHQAMKIHGAPGFPDNAVYVKSDNMELLTDKQRIEQLAMRDPTVKIMLDVQRTGAMSYERMLEGLVVLLAQQKEAAVAQAIDVLNRTPPMTLTEPDAHQAQLELEQLEQLVPQPVSRYLNQIAPGAAK